jgi:hypothetical protein
MICLITAAALLIAAATSTFACDWNKSAATDTHSTTAASQSDSAAHSKPAQHYRS